LVIQKIAASLLSAQWQIATFDECINPDQSFKPAGAIKIQEIRRNN
jgi:hypothetical protein